MIKPQKTNRLAHAHRKLVAHLSGRGEPVKSPSFAGGVVSAVNCFLNVAAGFFQNLAHLARHVRGELFLVADQDLAETKQQFSAFGGRRVAPAIEGVLRGIDRGVYVVAGGERKASDDVAIVGGVDVFKHLARLAGDPLSVDVVLIGFDCGACRIARREFAAGF